MKHKILTLVVAVVSHLGFAQEINTAKLDAYFKALEDNQKMMGSVIIAKEGKPIYTKSVGFANVEKGIKNDENTRFRIGSITKTFTAVLVLKAVEEGKLNLNDKLSKFYPKIKNSEKITIENILQNRSGLVRDVRDLDKEIDQMKGRMTEQDFINRLATFEPNFEPNTQYQYSNSNFILLGYIAEKVFKKSYADLLQKYIAKPLDLKNTYLGDDVKSDEALSYSFENKKWEKMTKTHHISHAGGAGAVISSTKDLLKFIEALPKILKKETFEKMKNFKNRYGFGLMELPFYEYKGYGHGGDIDQFHSTMGYFPNEKISFVKVINGTNMDKNDFDLGVLSILFNKDFEIPTFKTIEVREADLKPFLGEYFNKEIGMKIKVFNKRNQLFAEADGQQEFPLEATEKHMFKFDAAGIVLEFTEKGKMILKQSGHHLEFVRE